MNTMIINPLVVQVKENNPDVILPVDPTMHGGSVGRVIGVVAAVAVPFAAPAIASAVAASGALGAAVSAAMTTTIGGVVSSAIVGAAIGGIGATIAGQPFSVGALTGALTGGIGGYAQGVSATGGAEQVAGGAGGGAPAAGLSGGPQTYTGGFGEATTGIGVEQGAQLAAQTAEFGSAITQTPVSLMETLSQTSQAVASKLKDPKNLANITMQAASSLAGEALVPEGTLAQLSPEEQALIEERKVELTALRDRDLEAYNQAIEISKAYMVQANQIDPTYFAQQEANKSKIDSARTIRGVEEKAALDNMSFTDADTRRLGLDANRLSASAYDKGFSTGLDTRNTFVSAAQDTMPTASQTVNYSQGLAGLQDVYAGQRAAADKERESYQMMFAGLNTKEGNTDEDVKRKAKLYDDAMTSLYQKRTT